MTRRRLIGLGAVVLAVVFAILATGGDRPAAPSIPGESTPRPGDIASPSSRPGPVPVPGHEVVGFVPYWEMDDGIAEHVAATDLTTLALFSVTHTKDGSINETQAGYRKITGEVGRRLIEEAHDRGVAVELVYTSFGPDRNRRFYGSPARQDATIEALVALADRLGVDGIDVDVEQLGIDLVPAYGAFVGRVREALRATIPDAVVSASTGAGRTGALMARAAAEAGADRIFLMGYDYHYGASEVGASAPMDRRDGSSADLVWSLDLYAAAGVPPERTILGLPLYGLRWRVAGPELGAPRLGNGVDWVPGDNPKFLADPPLPPQLDPIEVVEFYAVPPTVTPEPGDSRATAGWQAIYVDSPRTLEPKLALADDRGLAGAGFWAIGYERGLPEYADLIARFAAGNLR